MSAQARTFRSRLSPGLLALVCAAAAACGDDKPAGSPSAATSPPAAAPARETPATPPPKLPPAPSSPRAPYRVVAVEHGGTIAGVCRLDGVAEPMRLHAWPAMGVEEGQSDESVAEGAGHVLGGCLVWLADVAEGKDWAAEMRSDERRFTLTVQPGRFDPHLTWVRVATQLVVTCRLAAAINVHGYLGAGHRETVFNFNVAPGLSIENSSTFLDRPGVRFVTDDGQGAFTAWIHVLANPYADITSAEPKQGRPAGEYRLEDVPPGDYDLVCWHEPMDRHEQRLSSGPFGGYVLGRPIELRQRVHVAAGETTGVDFKVPARVTEK